MMSRGEGKRRISKKPVGEGSGEDEDGGNVGRGEIRLRPTEVNRGKRI